MSKTKGTLYLIPTPIGSELPLSKPCFDLISEAIIKESDHIFIEDLKATRKRWTSWGFPRSYIEHLICFNEHNQNADQIKAIEILKGGDNILLMSDGGIPGFCDPGAPLIRQCHQRGVRVKLLPIDNSLIWALTLSGLGDRGFDFLGFPPRKSDERDRYFKELSKKSTTSAIMDTPYRLQKTLENLVEHCPNHNCFFAFDLGSENEYYSFGAPKTILKRLRSQKAPFVAIISI